MNNHWLFLVIALPFVGCTQGSSSPPATRRYGDAMGEIGMRFERAGRAVAVGRFELARFQIHEIEEVFDEDLPHAAPPKVAGNVDLVGASKAFARTNLKELDVAAESKDKGKFAAAFQRAAEACNACHLATSHGFIEISTELGAGVPRLDALPASSAH